MLPYVYKYFAVTLLFLTSSLSSASKKDYFSKLKTAVSVNDVNTVGQLLRQNSTDWLTENQGWEIACIAAEKGNLPMIEYIAKRKLSILEKKNEENETIGHIAAKHGHPKITEYFLKKTKSYRWSPSGSERQSLFDLIARKGHLNCITGITYSDDFERIARTAAQNGHLDIACYIAMEKHTAYCKDYEGIIRTAIENSSKRDPNTMELFGKLTDGWRKVNYCPNMVELASSEKSSELLKYLAEKKCTLFLSSYKPMEIAFERNLVNQTFLNCLEEGNGDLQGYLSVGYWWVTTIGHLAAQHGRLDVIQFLAEKNASVLDAVALHGKTVVDIAAEKGYADIVRYAVRRKPSIRVLKTWNQPDRWSAQLYDAYRDKRYSTAFHLAVAKNWMDMDTLRFAVEKAQGADLITRADSGDAETVAHAAARNANIEILQYLVEKKPSVLSMSNSSGYTVLGILARGNNLGKKLFTSFVDMGAPLAVRNGNQDTVGHIVAKNGRNDLVEYLAEKDPSSLTIADRSGDTVLHILARGTHAATNNTNIEILQYVVKKQPSVLSQLNSAGDSILHILARNNVISVKNLRFFVDEGASLLAYNNQKENIPLIASKNGNLEILQFIVEKESSVLEGNASIGVEMADVAASHGHSNILKFIVDKKRILLADRPSVLFKLPKPSEVLDTLQYLKTACDTKITNWDREHFESEVFRKACDCDYPDVLRFMKYDVNTMNDQGEPLIFTAARRYRHNIFYYLANDGRTNLTALDRAGNNILFITALTRNLKKMQYILDTLKVPINLEWRNCEGDAVLHVAVNEALEQAVTLADEKKQSGDDYYYSGEVDTSVIKYLVEVKHANINALGQGNKTALYHAMSRSNYDICTYLLNHGADPKLRNANGHNFWHEIRFPSPETTEKRQESDESVYD